MLILIVLFVLFVFLLGMLTAFLIIKKRLLCLIPRFFNSYDFQKELESKLDPSLEKLILEIKKQVPPLNLFLTESLKEKLKAISKQELFLLLPEITSEMKEKIVNFLKKEGFL